MVSVKIYGRYTVLNYLNIHLITDYQPYNKDNILHETAKITS